LTVVSKTNISGLRRRRAWALEFMLRLMAWLCTFKQTNRSGSIGNGQMCIVTGPNIDIATKLIKRLKGIFDTKLGLTFNDKETVLQLNGYSIEAYPSNHLDAYRSLLLLLFNSATVFFKYYMQTNSNGLDMKT
jgi:hypothetical protein